MSADRAPVPGQSATKSTAPELVDGEWYPPSWPGQAEIKVATGSVLEQIRLEIEKHYGMTRVQAHSAGPGGSMVYFTGMMDGQTYHWHNGRVYRRADFEARFRDILRKT